jgi:sugar lactone lactonase YvrE
MGLRSYVITAFALSLALAGCSGSRQTTPQSGGTMLETPQSVSPGSIAPAPMAKTAILPASVMNVRPQTAIQGLNWTQISGSASLAAAAPDGSLWVLSDQPSGANKFIWHYANGSWSNISGMASRIAVAPDGTLYAINSGGGTYSYSGGTWTALGGGCSDVTVAKDGTIYVLSNGNSAGSDQAIWHNVSGTWSQVPGQGVRIAGSWDASSYMLSGGTVAAGGIYILNSIGSIYYENTNNSFVLLPGSASAVTATTNGGIFVLGYPADAGGNSIYYYDLNNPGWNAQSGASVSISTDSAHLYAIASSGGIYSTPVTLAPQTLYVPNYNGANVGEWPITASGNVAPTVQIGGSNTTISGPTAVTRDTTGTLYVADFNHNAVDVFASGLSGNVAPTLRIIGSSTGISGPEGIGVDSSGNIYVSNRAAGSVTVYAAGATGNVAPTRTISGANTGLTNPQKLAVNPGGDFYVSDASVSSIFYFAAGASGNVAPTRTISGSSTNLNPYGIAVDSSGNIYAVNNSCVNCSTITVYAAGSNGNVAPSRTITGSSTMIVGGLQGIAVDSSGNIYVTTCQGTGPDGVYVFAAGANGNVAPSQSISGASTGMNCPTGLFVF